MTSTIHTPRLPDGEPRPEEHHMSMPVTRDQAVAALRAAEQNFRETERAYANGTARPGQIGAAMRALSKAEAEAARHFDMGASGVNGGNYGGGCNEG